MRCVVSDPYISVDICMQSLDIQNLLLYCAISICFINTDEITIEVSRHDGSILYAAAVEVTQVDIE